LPRRVFCAAFGEHNETAGNPPTALPKNARCRVGNRRCGLSRIAFRRSGSTTGRPAGGAGDSECSVLQLL
jgi:hypothetical protein